MKAGNGKWEMGNSEKQWPRALLLPRTCTLQRSGHQAGAARNRRFSHSPFPIPNSRLFNGFTLIEMLAVIVLIAIAATVLSLSISHGLGAARVRAASTDLAAALRYTRMQAIAHAQPQVLKVNVQARSYQEPGRNPHVLPPGMQLTITSARIEQSGGHVGAIRFFADGSSTGGRVTLRRGNREWHVNVAWLTGAVSVVTAPVQQ